MLIYAYLTDEELTEGDSLLASFDLEAQMTEAEHEELTDYYRRSFDKAVDKTIGEIAEALVKSLRGETKEQEDD